METVYLETTFISYLVARPSRDLLVAAHQQVTQDWWTNRRSEFEIRISQVVIDEASAGDPAEVQKRLAIGRIAGNTVLRGRSQRKYGTANAAPSSVALIMKLCILCA